MIQQVLDTLAERPDDPVFLGIDRITRAEFKELVWSYAGGLRKRKARNFALIARPGPTTLALALAAVGMGVRVDLIDPRGGSELVAARVESAVPDFVVAEPGLKFALKGPRWLRDALRLPDWRIWPDIVGIDDLGAAQVRRFGVEDDQSALLVFTSGTTDEPKGIVHTAGSLSAGMGMVASLFDADASRERPVVADTFFAMLPALATGLPIVRPAKQAKKLARQLARWEPTHTYLTPPMWRAALDAGATLTGRAYAGSATVTASLLQRLRDAGAEQAWGVYAMTEVFPIAAVESREKLADDERGDHVGRLFDGVEARMADDGELIYSGASMAPRHVEGDWVDEVASGDLGELDGRDVFLHGRKKDMVLVGARNIYPGLYEPRLSVDGVDVALLVGVPADDGDERLVLLAQAANPTPALRKTLETKARRMDLPLADIVFDEVPLSGRSRKPDRAAARERLAGR